MASDSQAPRKTYPDDVLKRLQDVEREILGVIDTMCRKNHLDYFIDGGTCLGAVRHGGFIPWDDDVDIAMPYNDYLRFCELAQTELPSGYSLHDCNNTKGFSALWAKVFKDGTLFMDENCVDAGCKQGIFVDVFPLFPLDADERKAAAQRSSCLRWQSLSYLHHFAHPKVSRTAKFRGLIMAGCCAAHYTIARFIDSPKAQKKMFEAAQTDNPGTNMFNPCYASYELEEQWLFPTRDITFDGMILRAPSDCDSFLSCYYGNYMQLPPLEDRYTHLPLILDFGDGVNVMDS